ncbi:C40 family peptidase [Thermohalobacter berrensis]|uniref:NlpC/P60 domain-containing protein n=1 Tax=Thermohalobacter berrensis TaxID=99594 RepID=A0A419T163_9FIRM|nr:C40 family peptidase [Thermohalobacter berrensis]RKD31207.1 hypothetical protein BET03_03510 [Thermohalobacter berrensis]
MAFTGYKNETLLAEIEKYTKYQYNGISLDVPYHLGGKNTVEQITSYIDNNYNGDDTSSSQLQSFMDNNTSGCGVDCSGFVYITLDNATSGDFSNVIGESRYYTNVEDMIEHSTEVTDIKDIRPNDLIFFTGHVAVIYEVEYAKNPDTGLYEPWRINYAHSSRGGVGGPHKGYIILTDMNDLSNCEWRDSSSSYQDYLADIFTHVGRW